MTPEERQQFEEMKETLENIKAALDIDFAENIKRNVFNGVVTKLDDGVATSITVTADSGMGTVDCAKAPDNKTKIRDVNGRLYYVATYDS